MRFDKFTLKAQEVIQTSQQLAERYNHQQIEPEHLVRAILEQAEGVIPPLLGKIGVDQRQLMESFEAALLSPLSSTSHSENLPPLLYPHPTRISTHFLHAECFYPLL